MKTTTLLTAFLSILVFSSCNSTPMQPNDIRVVRAGQPMKFKNSEKYKGCQMKVYNIITKTMPTGTVDKPVHILPVALVDAKILCGKVTCDNSKLDMEYACFDFEVFKTRRP